MAGILDGSQSPLDVPPIDDLVINDIGLAPRETFVVHGLVKERVPDSEVQEIMQGHTRRLFAWGRVTYDDVYGGSWYTNFFMNYEFRKIGNDIKVFGGYHPKHNDFT